MCKCSCNADDILIVFASIEPQSIFHDCVWFRENNYQEINPIFNLIGCWILNNLGFTNIFLCIYIVFIIFFYFKNYTCRRKLLWRFLGGKNQTTILKWRSKQNELWLVFIGQQTEELFQSNCLLIFNFNCRLLWTCLTLMICKTFYDPGTADGCVSCQHLCSDRGVYIFLSSRIFIK